MALSGTTTPMVSQAFMRLCTHSDGSRGLHRTAQLQGNSCKISWCPGWKKKRSAWRDMRRDKSILAPGMTLLYSLQLAAAAAVCEHFPKASTHLHTRPGQTAFFKRVCILPITMRTCGCRALHSRISSSCGQLAHKDMSLRAIAVL